MRLSKNFGLVLAAVFMFSACLILGAPNASAFEAKAGKIVTKDINGVKFHTYMTMGVNNHVIETSKSLVLMDVGQAKPNNDELKAFMASLNKPLARIYISHDHAHHWIGLSDFPNVPVYALPDVIAFIKEHGAEELQKAKKQMGDQVVPYTDVVIPQNAVTPGEEDIDGVKFLLINPETPFLKGNLYIEFPDQKAIIHHHLAYVGVHVPMPPIGPRLDVLKAYKAKDYAWVMAGHGLSLEGGPFFDQSIKYYETLAKVVKEAPDPAAAKAEMKAAYPDWGGDFLLDLMLPLFYKK